MNARPHIIRVGDHDPEKISHEPSAAQVKVAFEWSRDEILMVGCDLKDATDKMIEAFRDGRHSEIMLAAGVVQKYARKIDGLAASLIKGCRDQMNRKPRP